MKYIRTKDGRIGTFVSEELGYAFHTHNIFYEYWKPNKEAIVKQSDTIEELCDEFVISSDSRCDLVYSYDNWDTYYYRNDIEHSFILEDKTLLKGVVWTDKGLIYVAKMNDKGELELL